MKKIILLLFLALFFTNSCRNEATLNDDKETVVPEFKYNYGNEISRNFFGQVLDRSGNPVSGATISIGTSTVQTTSKGFFMLKNVSVKENFAHIKASKAGFANAARVVLPTTGDNRINIMMVPATVTSTINSGATSTVSLPDGSSVKFDGSFKNENGSVYSGAVKVALFNLKTSDTYFNETMPGNLLAADSQGNAKLLESYGMMHVQLTGDAGQNLQIADGHTAEITSPIDVAQLSTSPSSIPLWSFDETLGVWREEGSANKVGNKYVGTVKHFSWWNCDIPQNMASLKLTVTNSTNQVLAGLRVGLKTASMNYEMTAVTNANGVASGSIIANQNLQMKIYDDCNNVLYSGNIGPFAAGSVNNLTQSINATIQTHTITGTLLDCAGNNVTNGLAQLIAPNGNYYFNNVILPVANGQFSFNAIVCSTNQQFQFIGYDYNSAQSSGNIAFIASTPNVNLGFITTCTAAPEFVNYSIDGQAPKNFTGLFNASISGNGPSNGNRIFHGNDPTTSQFSLTIPAAIYVSTGFSVTGFYGLQFKNNLGNIVAVGDYNTQDNNVKLQFNYIGPVGGYIDFTLNGTYIESGVSHTISGTGHVLRDN